MPFGQKFTKIQIQNYKIFILNLFNFSPQATPIKNALRA